MEHISVRFANSRKEYVRSLTPMAFTANFAESFKVTEEVDKIDYTWVHDNVLNTIEHIYMNDGMQTLLLWVFDEADNDFVMLTLIYDPAGKIGGRESWDPTSSPSTEARDAAKIIMSMIQSEIFDIYMRCKSSTATISSTMASMGRDAGTTGTATASSELDKLCEDISANTKAEIVKPKETLKDYICNDLPIQLGDFDYYE